MAPYEEAAISLSQRDLARLQEDACARVERAGLLRRPGGRSTTFPLDVVPRVLPAAEWERLEAGLAQRVTALNAFVADVYGARRIVRAGVVPARVIETAEHYEPGMRGVEPPGGLWVGIAGLDLVRDPTGEFLVLEDNLMTPSGFAYAAAARDAVAGSLDLASGDRPRGYEALPDLLGGALRAAATGEYLVVLADGPSNGAYWEHAWATEQLAIPFVRPSELHRRGDHLVHGGQRVGGIYRRTDADLLRTGVGALLAPAIRAGTVGVVNAFGTGVGDDKLAHAYVEDMIRFYLGQEPLVRSVQTLDLARRDHLEQALDRFAELVVKPRAGHGGIGVLVAPLADVHARFRSAARDARRPHAVRDRRGADGGQLDPERRVQGHVGAQPLIGITTSEVRRKKDAKPLPFGDLKQPELALGVIYSRAVEEAGGIPVVLPPLGEGGIAPLVDRLEGLCVSGGPDMDPAAYGAEPHPKLGPVESELDAFELAVVRRADALGIPVLGICRGCQVVNVARGGTLHQHVPDVGDGSVSHRQAESGRVTTHDIRIERGSRLASIVGPEDLDVNAFHHQAVDRLGRGLRAVAWADDGIVEAIEAGGEALYLGVQWHVETLTHLSRHARVFEALVDEAIGDRMSRAGSGLMWS